MIAVVKFPGTNCHYDMVNAFAKVGSDSVVVDYRDMSLPCSTNLVVIPGGFSYGDYLRSGAIAARSEIMGVIRRYASNGGYVLGICNGFQILCEAGLLPGALLKNSGLNFISRSVKLTVVSNNNKMLRDYTLGREIVIQVANGYGNYYVDKHELESMKVNDQILLRYTSDINGSIDRIAGICNKDKNIFALMPHPERAMNVKSINFVNPDFSSDNIDGFLMLRSLSSF